MDGRSSQVIPGDPAVPAAVDAKIAARTARSHAFVPYITRKDPVLRSAGERGTRLLEHNADTILEEIGIDFRDDPESLKIWKDAGADVQGERVRFHAACAAASCGARRRRNSPSMRATPRATW